MEQQFKSHPLDWLVEDLRAEESYLERPMFGCRACYLMGELKLVLASSGEEPWNGLLVATCRERQPSLISTHPELGLHPILPKWLYISESSEHFERVAQGVVRLVQRGDPRIGVEPQQKPRSGRSKKRKKPELGSKRREHRQP